MKNKKNIFGFNNAQGAIEYLLIIGAAIIVVAISVNMISGIATNSTNATDDSEGIIETGYNTLTDRIKTKAALGETCVVTNDCVNGAGCGGGVCTDLWVGIGNVTGKVEKIFVPTIGNIDGNVWYSGILNASSTTSLTNGQGGTGTWPKVTMEFFTNKVFDDRVFLNTWGIFLGRSNVPSGKIYEYRIFSDSAIDNNTKGPFLANWNSATVYYCITGGSCNWLDNQDFSSAFKDGNWYIK